MLESGSLRRLSCTSLGVFDVENDDDVRDAVVADDGGGGERADAAARDGGAEVDDGDRASGTREDVEPHQRLVAFITVSHLLIHITLDKS